MGNRGESDCIICAVLLRYCLVSKVLIVASVSLKWQTGFKYVTIEH